MRKTGWPILSQKSHPEAYLPLRDFSFFTVSTTCVFGLRFAVATVVKRPVIALRPTLRVERAICTHPLSRAVARLISG